eukprot:g10713.t1
MRIFIRAKVSASIRTKEKLLTRSAIARRLFTAAGQSLGGDDDTDTDTDTYTDHHNVDNHGGTDNNHGGTDNNHGGAYDNHGGAYDNHGGAYDNHRGAYDAGAAVATICEDEAAVGILAECEKQCEKREDERTQQAAWIIGGAAVGAIILLFAESRLLAKAKRLQKLLEQGYEHELWEQGCAHAYAPVSQQDAASQMQKGNGKKEGGKKRSGKGGSGKKRSGKEGSGKKRSGKERGGGLGLQRQSGLGSGGTTGARNSSRTRNAAGRRDPWWLDNEKPAAGGTGWWLDGEKPAASGKGAKKGAKGSLRSQSAPGKGGKKGGKGSLRGNSAPGRSDPSWLDSEKQAGGTGWWLDGEKPAASGKGAKKGGKGSLRSQSAPGRGGKKGGKGSLRGQSARGRRDPWCWWLGGSEKPAASGKGAKKGGKGSLRSQSAPGRGGKKGGKGSLRGQSAPGRSDGWWLDSEKTAASGKGGKKGAKGSLRGQSGSVPPYAKGTPQDRPRRREGRHA